MGSFAAQVNFDTEASSSKSARAYNIKTHLLK